MNHESKIPIIILHGWYLNHNFYTEIKKIFEKNEYTVFVPDLPGFGDEKLIKPVMDLDDYVDFVLNFFKKNKIKSAIIIGHSFGGRIATKIAYFHPELVNKLILTGVPLIRSRQSLAIKLMAFVGVSSKVIFNLLPDNWYNFFRKVLYKLIGQWDYYKAGILKETFKKIINEDLSKLTYGIEVPTLLVWGKEEKVVSVSVGEEINRRILNSKFILVENATHMLPCRKPEEFSKVVLDFILKK